MSKSLKVGLITIIVLAVAYTVASWAIGLSVQSRLQLDQQRLLANGSYLVPLSTAYHRGIFGSSEQVTYGLGGPAATLLQRFDPKRGADAWRLTVRERIHHGPLPQLRAFALASVDSQLLTPVALRAALGDRVLVQGHSVLGWLGDSRSQLSSPGLQYQLADGSALVWNGVTGRIDTRGRLSGFRVTLTAPGFSLQGPRGLAQIVGFTLQADMQRVFETLYVGHTSVRLQDLELTPKTGATLALKGLSFQDTSSVNDQYIDQTGQLSADALQIAQFSATRIGYVQTVAHLHGPSLAGLMRALREAQQTANGGVMPPARLAGAFRQYGVELALHEPVLDISSLGFAMPEGELRLSARISMPGIERQDLQAAQGPLALAALATHLNVSADLRVDAALAARLIGGSARAAAYSAQIQQLLQQGYLRQQGGAYLCHLSYQGGRLTINDQPFPPRPATAAP